MTNNGILTVIEETKELLASARNHYEEQDIARTYNREDKLWYLNTIKGLLNSEIFFTERDIEDGKTAD